MNKTFFFLAILIVLVFGITVVGCEGDNGGGGDETSAQAPNITSQPRSRVYFPGVTAEPLTVTASVSDGGSLSYLWYKSDSAFGEKTNVEGANAASYTPSTATTGIVYYSVAVTNTNHGKTSQTRSESAQIVTGFKEAKRFPSATSSIAFNGDRFVIGRAYGQTAWSDDGINWTEVDASNVFGKISPVHSIAFVKDKFIAICGYSDNSKIGLSTKGESWTEIDASSIFKGTSKFVYGIVYYNNRFFAWGEGTRTAYSDDDWATWTQKDCLKGGRIVAGNNNFIMFGGTDSGTAYIELFNSTYWQGNNLSKIKAGIDNMIFANNNFFAVSGNKIYKNSRSDFSSLLLEYDWTDISPTNIGSNNIRGIGYGANRLILFTSSDIAWSDDDGANWTGMSLETPGNMVAYGKGCFVIVGGNSVYYTVYP